MTANSFLVGAFRNGATYYDREMMNVAIATQNEDDFVKNLLTIRAETRGALAVKMPEAFVTGNFNGVESE
jgi:HK97 family phage major capsid protein